MGVWLLENKVSPHVQFELFCTNTCKTTINETRTEIQKIAKAFEAYALFSQGVAGELSDKPNVKKCFSRRTEAEDLQWVDNA